MLETFAQWLVDVVHGFGYPGLFFAMFLGNALVPIPVEAIMIPAGYLVQQRDMNLVDVMGSAVAGDVLGSLFSFYIAYHFGRKFLYNFGKYFFFGHGKIEMLDRFFAGHGEISVLTGRLVPGLRHFMAFPAGLSHMNIKKFTVYTAIGGGLWMAVLVCVGYLIGGNKALVKHYMPYVEGVAIIGVVVMIALYVRHHRRKKDKSCEP
ncbi:MAG: DedA family protein [Pseudomonadota bacterium]|nr:DedA family protein [Pseudomonadota bacterium]MDE3038358.1 DedA family protein [Pseudomonadota bacterium]